MADFGSDGVWNQAGLSLAVDDLPVTPALRARILAWQSDYDDHDNLEGPFLDVDRFAAEGLEIATAVKRELPDWTVIYHDESKVGGQQARSAFEYEVVAPAPGPDPA